MNERAKIMASHLSRHAIVYLRQSSAAQVEHNRESTDRQYALATKARDLGWPDDRIIVIDEDLGLSGSGSVARSGFARLTAEVALTRVGLVLGLEVSRLARNNADWHRLIDLAGLTDHLMRSITLIGQAAGAQLPERDATDSVERQVIAAARPALDAWRRRGLDGTVKFGDNEAPARMLAGILSLEFLVHAWDYATAMERRLDVPDSLSDYVMGVAKTVITPDGRTRAGFDDPVDVATDARSLDKLVAYTGRNPR